jgi:zinc protease
MRRGTATRTGEAIDREAGFLGTQIGSNTQEDGFAFTFSTTQRFYEPALRIAADVIRNPSFPETEVAREKALQVAAIRRVFDSSVERPMQLFRTAMYGEHPYGLPELGTEQTVATFDRAKLESWWRGMISADRTMIVVVGDVDASDVRRVMEEQFGKLPVMMQTMIAPPEPKLPTSPREATEQRDRKQTAMVVGFPTVPPADPQWPAFRLMQAVTSGLGGTFFAELRGRQSLAYTVNATPMSFAQYGAFRGYLAGEASKEATAKAALLAEMRKLQGEGIQEPNLARAKAYYTGATLIAMETNVNRAVDYGRSYVLGVPLDHTDRVLKQVPGITSSDLRSAAKKYMAGDNYVYAAVRGK